VNFWISVDYKRNHSKKFVEGDILMLRITEERARESSEVRFVLVQFSVAICSTVHENIKCKES